MKARRFFLAALAGIALCFGVAIAALLRGNPFFILRGVDEGETARFSNQRYEMAGLIRHQDYSAVVMGTSLAANYRASWFTQGTGEKTLKITFPDGWISEFGTALELAFRTHGELSVVYFSLDPNILIRPDSERTVELPAGLYDSNPINDVEYLLNADTYAMALGDRLRNKEDAGVPLDEAYIWDGNSTFGWSWALAGYPRPEVSGTVLPEDAFLAAAEENLDVICAWAQAHPDTRFVIWFPPYSLLYWDKTLREGTADAVLTATEYAARRLTDCGNIELYSFLEDPSVTGNLNYYCDHIHCSGELTRQVAEQVMSGQGRLTGEEAVERLEGLREYIHSFDFEYFYPAE